MLLPQIFIILSRRTLPSHISPHSPTPYPPLITLSSPLLPYPIPLLPYLIPLLPYLST
jgi:hypothetical protein